MRRLGVTRRHLFETLERPALAALPDDPYEFAEWRLARVRTDYHVEFDAFFYSVPHGLIRQPVDLRATARTIEIFHRGKRIASHQRRYGGRRHGTDPDNMPSSHRRYAEWTPERFRRWGAAIGPSTEGLILAILAARPHPEQDFRTCMGVLRLYRDIDKARAEAVSARAVAIGGLNYKCIASLLRLAQTPVQKYLPILMDRIQNGEIDPSFIITHRGTLEEGPEAALLGVDAPTKPTSTLRVLIKHPLT